MKRKLEYVDGPRPKRHSFTLMDSIEKTFADPSFEKLQSLIEQFKGSVSFNCCVYLLKQLAFAMKIKVEGVSNEYKEPYNQLAKLAFEYIKKSFAISNTDFENWIRYGRTEKEISFLIYNLGMIASEFQVPFLEAQHLQFMLNFLFQMTKENYFFGKAFFGLGLLAQKTTGKYDAQLLQKILDKVSETKPPISGLIVENCIRGLGYLSQEKKLNDHISSELLIKLLHILLNTKIEKYQTISLSFFSIGRICTNGYLDGNIPALLMENLIIKLVEFTILPQKAIKNVLYLLGNLAYLEQLEGHFDLNCLELLLKKYSLVSPRTEIGKIFLNLGDIIYSQHSKGKLSDQVITNLANRFDFKNAQPNDVSNYIFGYIVVIKKLTLKADIKLISLALTKFTLSKGCSQRQFTQIFYALDRLAKSSPLDAIFATTTFETLIDQLIAFPSLSVETVVLAIHSLGYLQRAKSIDKPFSTLKIEKLLNFFNWAETKPLDGKLLIEGLAFLHRTIEWELLEPYVELAMSPSFLNPLYAAELYLSLHQFHHSQELKPYYEVLEKAFTPHKNNLPVTVLNDLIKHAEQIGQPVENPLSNKKILNTHRKKFSPVTPHAIRKVPSPHHSPPNIKRVAKNQPGNQILQSQLIRANKNEIYKAIAQQNIHQLLKILDLPITVLNEKSASYQGETHPKYHVKSNEKKIYSSIEKLIIDFFRNTGHEAFQHLLKNSESFYFYYLFKKCCQSVLFELTKSHDLNSLMVNLPLVELKKLIPQMNSPLQFYRDHKSLLNLIDGLTLRGEKNPKEQKELNILKNDLMQKGIDFHSRSNHLHVMQLLKSCLTKMNSGRLLCADNQFYSARFLRPHKNDSFIENEVQRFCCYLYETEDIQVLLKARLEEFPDISVLAAAQMNTHIPGNRVSDVLGFYLEDLKTKGLSQKRQHLVIPIQKSNHWTGLKITLHHEQIVAVIFFNSLEQDHNVNYLQMLRQDLLEAGIKIPIIAARCMQQIDETSCGPMLIENYYYHFKNQKLLAINPGITEEIRKNHLTLIEKKRPDFYPGFLERANNNKPSVPSLANQLASQGFFPYSGDKVKSVDSLLHEQPQPQ